MFFPINCTKTFLLLHVISFSNIPSKAFRNVLLIIYQQDIMHVLIKLNITDSGLLKEKTVNLNPTFF